MKIAIKASPDGAAIYAGDKLTHARTGHVYACARTNVYQNGAEVSVVPVEGAPLLDGGETLVWNDPRPGCAATSTVIVPITRADFDALAAKVDALAARFDKLLADNAVRLVTDSTPKTHTFTLDVKPSREMFAMFESMQKAIRESRGAAPDA